MAPSTTTPCKAATAGGMHRARAAVHSAPFLGVRSAPSNRTCWANPPPPGAPAAARVAMDATDHKQSSDQTTKVCSRQWALDCTQPQGAESVPCAQFDASAPPPFTLQDLRNAIPAHCWVKVRAPPGCTSSSRLGCQQHRPAASSSAIRAAPHVPVDCCRTLCVPCRLWCWTWW